MATSIEPRRLEDLEEDSLIAVELEWQRRARGLNPWTAADYLNAVERVHARYANFRRWRQQHPQGARTTRRTYRASDRPLLRILDRLADEDAES